MGLRLLLGGGHDLRGADVAARALEADVSSLLLFLVVVVVVVVVVGVIIISSSVIVIIIIIIIIFIIILEADVARAGALVAEAVAGAVVGAPETNCIICCDICVTTYY